MALPAKRKSEKSSKPRDSSKIGMSKIDDGKGPAKKSLSKPVGGLSKGQMEGGERPDEVTAEPKTRKTSKAKSRSGY